jgi:uridine kinase
VVVREERTVKVLYLIRGCSGSGKSTLAETIFLASKPSDREWNEADDFFYEGGEYKFDAGQLDEAHNQCYGKTLVAMRDGVPVVIVSNTFTRNWEMAPYLALVERYDYQVQEIIVKGRFGNVHNCPPEVVVRQRQRFEYV